MTKLVIAFRNYSKAPRKGLRVYRQQRQNGKKERKKRRNKIDWRCAAQI
jgi:hypothetical protein